MKNMRTCFALFRPEIFIDCRTERSDETSLNWIIEELSSLGRKAPKQIVYCQSIDSVSSLYRLFAAKNRLIDYVQMYHAHLPAKLKDDIAEEFSRENSQIRLLLCTVAFGMGIDVKDIERVIHWGVPATVEEYWQEVGRCSRDGRPGHAILYNIPGSVRTNRTKECMINLIKTNVCIRQHVMKTFQFKGVALSQSHNVCQDKCCNRCKTLTHNK